ncbi:hypothetical protein [Steroidobacter cummioxidans]|uniref:hypothetical protein n=1 Tax=Steroidobacter cummioxidans TaxID=1803913 RepID=UPI000E322E35|nr:hypothetical protein [Steroidobacter cummioxidans]
MNRTCTALLGTIGLSMAAAASAEHDIEFIAEHLPEAMMDNRYATLPVWELGAGTENRGYQVQAAYSSTTAGDLSISGPLLSVSTSRMLSNETRLGAFGFYDPLRLHSGYDTRPLQTLFAPETPIERPVDAAFTHLDGTATDFGAGLFWSRQGSEGWLGNQSWVAGLLWQRVELRDYRFDYAITSGPQSGLQGQIDFDGHYDHFTPFAGLELPRTRGDWLFTPHALFAYPLPRRGVQGHITGPGFDIYGDTAGAGNGKHFGDPSLTLGLTVTYIPSHLSIDAGTFLTQAFLEQQIHRGIQSNWLLSVTWTP